MLEDIEGARSPRGRATRCWASKGGAARACAFASCNPPFAFTPRGLQYFGTFTMLQTANIGREIEGVQTDVLLQAFADRILVLVTQLGKVGSLVSFALCKRSPMDC